LTSGKVGEIAIKSEGKSVRAGLIDYKAFISFALIPATAFLAYIGNEAWREFAIMTAMAISYWFKQVIKHDIN
jgi:hypothetical protein